MKCVPVHHGIPAVLHRDEPWLHRHSENGALSGNSIRIPKLGFNTECHLMQVKNIAECSYGEHSAILSASIKRQFFSQTFVVSICQWPLKTGFTVHV